MLQRMLDRYRATKIGLLVSKSAIWAYRNGAFQASFDGYEHDGHDEQMLGERLKALVDQHLEKGRSTELTVLADATVSPCLLISEADVEGNYQDWADYATFSMASLLGPTRESDYLINVQAGSADPGWVSGMPKALIEAIDQNRQLYPQISIQPVLPWALANAVSATGLEGSSSWEIQTGRTSQTAHWANGKLSIDPPRHLDETCQLHHAVKEATGTQVRFQTSGEIQSHEQNAPLASKAERRSTNGFAIDYIALSSSEMVR